LYYSLKIENYLIYLHLFLVSSSAQNKGMRHPCNAGGVAVMAFLPVLTNEHQVSPATRRQAINAFRLHAGGGAAGARRAPCA